MPPTDRASFISLSICMCFLRQTTSPRAPPPEPLSHWLELPIQNRSSTQRPLCLVLDLFFSGCTGALLLHGLSVVARILCCAVEASHCEAQALGCDLSSCSTQDSHAAVHMGPLQTRDRACVPYVGRWILTHWTTREVPSLDFKEENFQSFILE